MNKFDEIQINAGCPMSVAELFERLGEIEAEAEIEDNSNFGKNENLKTTSVRLSEDMLLIMDAVASSFGMSRNSLIGYAVGQFIADSISNYAIGQSKVLTPPASAGMAYEENAHEHFRAFINHLPLTDELRSQVYKMCKHDFFKNIGIDLEDLNVAN